MKYIKGLESRRKVAAIYIDLKKAFDAVNVDTLSRKLRTYSYDTHFLHGSTGTWWKNVEEFILVQKYRVFLEMSLDVTQRSIGSELLFAIFVIGIFTPPNHCQLALLADDTTANL